MLATGYGWKENEDFVECKKIKCFLKGLKSEVSQFCSNLGVPAAMVGYGDGESCWKKMWSAERGDAEMTDSGSMGTSRNEGINPP